MKTKRTNLKINNVNNEHFSDRSNNETTTTKIQQKTTRTTTTTIAKLYPIVRCCIYVHGIKLYPIVRCCIYVHGIKLYPIVRCCIYVHGINCVWFESGWRRLVIVIGVAMTNHCERGHGKCLGRYATPRHHVKTSLVMLWTKASVVTRMVRSLTGACTGPCATLNMPRICHL